MGYRFLEDVSIADVAFIAKAADLQSLFKYCSDAVTNTMVKNIKDIRQNVKKKFHIKAKDIDMLLFMFIEKIIYYKDVYGLVFKDMRSRIKKKGNLYLGEFEASGEKLDGMKHDLLVDVKAATFHMLEVKKSGKMWSAMVVLDI